MSSRRRAFPHTHCQQHRLKVSTLLNIFILPYWIMVITEAGDKSFVKSSLYRQFLPLGKRTEFSHLKTSHTIMNMYINKGNCKILLQWLYFNSFFTRYRYYYSFSFLKNCRTPFYTYAHMLMVIWWVLIQCLMLADGPSVLCFISLFCPRNIWLQELQHVIDFIILVNYLRAW